MGCLYQYYGGNIKFLEGLEGMWGLIFYNIKNNEFLIGRDHIGKSFRNLAF
jgi:asparagine synthetase B (glutamine-hydrolysing)